MTSETTDDAPPRLVSTAAAARAVGVNRSTLSRWADAGVITPAQRTVGGHMRWDLVKLQQQLDQAGAINSRPE